MMDAFVTDWQEWLRAGMLVGGAILASLIIHALIFWMMQRAARKTGNVLDDSFLKHSRAPARWILPLLAARISVVGTALPEDARTILGHATWLGLIAALAWLVIRMNDVLQDVVGERYRLDVPDNLEARRILTQIRVFRRITTVVVSILALGLMLMTFPEVRRIGAGLFASAGVAGLVVGLAARSTLSNLLAGLQIALTQPIRIDDVVIVEGEWGKIEEITTTYVVVRIWDLRRMVVPLSYFIEQPFQNWTRVTADLVGTVFLYTDYTVPVEEVRNELKRVLDDSGMWDGKSWGLQVTDTTDRSMTLRALMSAPDSGTAWNLRCHVREKLLAYLQEKYPGSLPRARAEVSGLATQPEA